MDSRFSPFSHIRSVVNKDGGVLLDLKRGRCLSLNPVGGQVWSILQQHSEGVTVPGLVDELLPVLVGVDRATLECDMSAFLPELASKGLVSNGNGPHPAPSFAKTSLPRFDQVMLSPIAKLDKPALESIQSQAESSTSSEKGAFLYTALAMLALIGVDLTLKVAGFSRLYRIVKRWPTRRWIALRSPSIPGIIASVDAACSFYLKRALCLQRSVVATCILRLAGVPAQMVLAARVMPFHGHAWVEAEGEVVNDKQAVQTFYQVLDRC
jgi:hypothetical protein